MQFNPVAPKCESCPLKCDRVGATGPEDASIVIVCDVPTNTDKRMNRPLAGTSGDILWPEIPEEMRNDIYVTFAVPCVSVMNKDEKFKTQALKACHDRLMGEIEAHPRKVIITLGNGANRSVLNDQTLMITKERGKLVPVDCATVGVLPIINPIAIARGSGSLKQFKADVKYAIDLASGSPRRVHIKPIVTMVDKDNVDAIVRRICEFPVVSSDTETGGFDRQHDEVLCLGVSGDPYEVFMFTEEMIEDPNYIDRLAPMFIETRWIWQNGKFDMGFMRRNGHKAYTHEDTMLLSYCLDETPGLHDLEQLSKNLLGAPDYKHMVKPYLINKKTSYRVIPKDVLHPYCAFDVSNTLQVWYILHALVMADPALSMLYTDTLIPASEMLTRVEARGMLIDQEWLGKMDDANNPESPLAKVNVARKAIQDIAGYAINPNSPIQMAKLLFDELKLPKKKGRSTDKKVMKMMPDLPIIRALKAHRTVAKTYSTYVKAMWKHIKHDTGLVHTTFKIHGTRTGRLASADPNIQNIPRDPTIRGMFIPRPGYEFVEVDLNQAELRCLAQLSRCEDLMAIYNDPTHEGLHHETSRALFGDDFTSEQKMRAKAVNFGIVYGREALSLAEEFGTLLSEGQRWIDGWFKRFPGAAKFIKDCRDAAVKGKTITTLFGRKKRNSIVTRETLKQLQNQSANFPHQSIASDITLRAAIRVQDELEAKDIHIVVLVHDSIMAEVPIRSDNSLRDYMIKICSEAMEGIPVELGLTHVPFLTDAKVSQERWGALKSYVPKKG